MENSKGCQMIFQYNYGKFRKVLFYPIIFIVVCLTFFSNALSQEVIDDPPGPGKICGLCSIYEIEDYCMPCSDVCSNWSEDGYDSLQECLDLCCLFPDPKCGGCFELRSKFVCTFQCNECEVCLGDNPFDSDTKCVDKCPPHQYCVNGNCIDYCECSSGDCCDGCNYYGTNQVCSTSSVCGGAGSPDKCQVVTTNTYCSGNSEDCDGEIKTITTNVASGKVCDTATNTIVSGSSTNYAFESDYNRCSEPNSPQTGFGVAVKDVYACNGANARGNDVGDQSMICSNGCCYDAGSEAFCDIFGNQAYNYWDFGIPDQTRNDYCVDLNGRRVKDCKDDKGCRNRDEAYFDTNHSQAFYLCTNQYDCKRSCYAQPCLTGQYTCADYYWNGTTVTYYCVNTESSKMKSSFVFSPAGGNANQRYCREDEYVNGRGNCELKPSVDLEQCFLPTNCGKTGIASLFDARDSCGGKMGYCNFSSGEIVSLTKSYVKIPANTDNPPKGQGEFPHAGRVFGYNYQVYEADADNPNAIGFSKLAKFNNDGSREESGLFWDTCTNGNVVERYSNPSFSTESSSVFSKQYNCECLNIDYPNYNLAICKTNPGSSQRPVKTMTYTPSGDAYEAEEYDLQDVPPQSTQDQTFTDDETTGSTDTSTTTPTEDKTSGSTDMFESTSTPVKKCTDRTALGECSASKIGYKCEDFKLVSKCTECGCPQGYACNAQSQRCCRTIAGIVFGCK